MDWKTRLDTIVAMMRDVSRQTDPQAMVRAYSGYMRTLQPMDGFLSVTRRDTEPPFYRIARSTLWDDTINPWKERDKLPVMQGGLLGELVYGNEPRIIDDLRVADDDPAKEYFEGLGSLVAIPVFDHGEALNVAIQMRKEPYGFAREEIPELVWVTNLFGRATHNLVLSEEVREAHEALDRELAIVGEIQRSLLPTRLPRIDGLDLAVHYQASTRAGGDYYDVFELPGDRWGFLVADVSGHGTPAAVLMAITHAIAHLYPGAPTDPHRMLTYINEQLCARYMRGGVFITAFYCVYDARARTLSYANAGHPPPRIKNCNDGDLRLLDGTRDPPLGVTPGRDYGAQHAKLRDADQIVIFTDGIPEARSPDGEFFGVERIDDVLQNCWLGAEGLAGEIIDAVEKFIGGAQAEDDITLLVARVG